MMTRKALALGLAAIIMLTSLFFVPVSSREMLNAQEPTATPTSIKGQPFTAVSTYFRALVSKNKRRVTAAVCAAWTTEAVKQVDSFGGVIPSLSRLSCKATGVTGDIAVVACSGKIVVNYNGNKRSLDLSTRIYRAQAEGGVWKMCGYQE